MPNMGLYLTGEQRARLEKLAEIAERSMNNVLARLIDQAWAAYQERITETAGAQNPEPGTAPQGQRDEINAR